MQVWTDLQVVVFLSPILPARPSARLCSPDMGVSENKGYLTWGYDIIRILVFMVLC